jgi:DNA-directed RNA polymerase III subunit RPC6
MQFEVDDSDDGVEHYRPMHHQAPETTALTSIPCGVCPVIEHCHDDGVVSPATCEYYNKWLQF